MDKGIYFYDNEENSGADNKSMGSSIPDVTGYDIELGREKFTFDGNQYLITLKDPRGGEEAKFCFVDSAEGKDKRDKFAVALKNMTTGKQWDGQPHPKSGELTLLEKFYIILTYLDPLEVGGSLEEEVE